MAAYAATVSVDFPQPVQFGRSTRSYISGTVTVTNYNTTLAEITGITKYFKRLDTVIADGPTANGYILDWNSTSSAFYAWQGDYSTSVDGPLVQVASDTNLGAAKFVAFGIAK